MLVFIMYNNQFPGANIILVFVVYGLGCKKIAFLLYSCAGFINALNCYYRNVEWGSAEFKKPGELLSVVCKHAIVSFNNLT